LATKHGIATAIVLVTVPPEGGIYLILRIYEFATLGNKMETKLRTVEFA
jgi:hypothetical protein